MEAKKSQKADLEGKKVIFTQVGLIIALAATLLAFEWKSYDKSVEGFGERVVEDVPEEIVNREKEIYKSQALETGKPENVIVKIVDGKMKKFFTENCLLNQAYVREPDLTIEDLLNELIAKIGENITIRRFVRYQIGEQ